LCAEFSIRIPSETTGRLREHGIHSKNTMANYSNCRIILSPKTYCRKKYARMEGGRIRKQHRVFFNWSSVGIDIILFAQVTYLRLFEDLEHLSSIKTSLVLY
jgi:hypothetical protein